LSDRSDWSDWSDESDKSDPYALRHASAETVANTLLCLINQAAFLLRRQLQHLEHTFLAEGGFTERMYQKRKERRE